jgi:hypothetical protein
MGRIRAYYTTKHEDKPVYHDQDNCREGVQILGDNRSEAEEGLSGRSLCETCAELGYHTYTRWLATNGKTALEALKNKQGDLDGFKDEEAKCKAVVEKYEADRTTLAALKAQREELQSKSPLTAEDQAQLATLKKQYNELYNKHQQESVGYNKARDRLVFLDGNEAKGDIGKIRRTEAELAVVQKEATGLDEAATKLTDAREAALKGQKAEEVEVLADVVMNEARGQDPFIKKCVAYAYLNLTGGVRRAPLPEDKISYFTRSENRFGDPKEGDPRKYIMNVADSLDAVRQRLNDPNYATTDPTRGANRWASPANMSQEVRQQYNTKTGTYDWLNGAEKILVDDIPEETFTFYKVAK